MENYWVPGVNNHGQYGRWAFAEFTDGYRIQADFKDKVEAEFNKMIDDKKSVVMEYLTTAAERESLPCAEK